MRVNCKHYLGCRQVLIEEIRLIHYTTRDGEPYHKREERISEMRPAWFASCDLFDEEEIGKYCGKGHCDAYKGIGNANRKTKKERKA